MARCACPRSCRPAPLFQKLHREHTQPAWCARCLLARPPAFAAQPLAASPALPTPHTRVAAPGASLLTHSAGFLGAGQVVIGGVRTLRGEWLGDVKRGGVMSCRGERALPALSHAREPLASLACLQRWWCDWGVLRGCGLAGRLRTPQQNPPSTPCAPSPPPTLPCCAALAMQCLSKSWGWRRRTRCNWKSCLASLRRPATWLTMQALLASSPRSSSLSSRAAQTCAPR